MEVLNINIFNTDYPHQAKNQHLKSFDIENFKKLQEEFFEVQRRAFEATFRLEDDKKQAAKGQPSLTNEDTGAHWKNDPL